MLEKLMKQLDTTIKTDKQKNNVIMDTFISNINADIKAITQKYCSNTEKCKGFENLTNFTKDAQENLSKLITFLENINSHKEKIDSTKIKEFHKQVRFLVLVLENRLLPNSEERNALKKISDIVGKVPRLNDSVPVPEEIKGNDTKWKAIPYPDPSREKNNSIGFYHTTTDKKHDEVTRRTALENGNKIGITVKAIASNDTKSVAYSTAQIKDSTEVHIDHVQASADILERQKELVEAMNLDLFLREEILKSSSNNGYFIAHPEEPTILVGTKNFYMTYHNCLENLWPVDAGINVRKGASDFFECFKDNPIYQSCIQSIKKSLCQDNILYNCKKNEEENDMVLLGTRLKKFFEATHGFTVAIQGEADKERQKQAETAINLVNNNQGTQKTQKHVNNNSKQDQLWVQAIQKKMNQETDKKIKQRLLSAKNSNPEFDSDTDSDTDNSNIPSKREQLEKTVQNFPAQALVTFMKNINRLTTQEKKDEYMTKLNAFLTQETQEIQKERRLIPEEESSNQMDIDTTASAPAPQNQSAEAQELKRKRSVSEHSETEEEAKSPKTEKTTSNSASTADLFKPAKKETSDEKEETSDEKEEKKSVTIAFG